MPHQPPPDHLPPPVRLTMCSPRPRVVNFPGGSILASHVIAVTAHNRHAELLLVDGRTISTGAVHDVADLMRELRAALGWGGT